MPLTPPPFDPELADVLRQTAATVRPDYRLSDLARMRADLAPRPLTDAELTRDGAFLVEEPLVPGRAGRPGVRLLVCRPTGPVTTPRPLLYHVHGGGLIMGNRRSGMAKILDWAQATGAVAVSVEYRLAPEHPYPAALDDVDAGLLWAREHAPDLDADPTQTIVCGSSAGGGLAAALTQSLRDRGEPQPAGQMLLAPMLDDRGTSLSSRQMAGMGVWDRTSNSTGWTAYLGSTTPDTATPSQAAPGRAGDLSGLPPAYLDVGSAETFRDEVVAYAGRIWQSGGAAELHVWPGGFHSFENFAPDAALSRSCRAARLDWLLRALARTGERVGEEPQ
ncbi:alpha/beta hydrolase [Streptomyces sp. NPDC090106]|uniref:alpha/beta hydrolase n=1 Tax=Streptomyces sp. NPDC090106 TaxID=3365946 RepID=UPI0037FDDB33